MTLSSWETSYYRITRPLVIFGTSSLAEIANEYFTSDSIYSIEAFTVEKNCVDRDKFCGKPVVPFEDLANLYPSSEYSLFLAIGYDKGHNDLRTRIYYDAINKHYELASYVSSRAFKWDNVKIGSNVFIMEDNTIQPFVTIGDNNIFWSGNHIGHHSKIGNHNFFSSHVVVCGHVTIGNNCFFGVNSSIANNIEIPDRTFLRMGAVATKDYIYEMGKKRTYIQQ